MNTINQIGKAALSRIFTEIKRTEGTHEIRQTVRFQPIGVEFDLITTIFLHTNNGDDDFTSKSGQIVKVWGIETGLQNVEIKDGEMLLDSLTEVQSWEKKDVYPSHLIVIYWEENYFYPDRCGNSQKDVFVYRIFERQIEDIMHQRALLSTHSR